MNTETIIFLAADRFSNVSDDLYLDNIHLDKKLVVAYKFVFGKEQNNVVA